MSDKTKYPSQAADRFQVRMPDGLREKIRLAAEANGRAMNTEIVMRLEQSFENDTLASNWAKLSNDLLSSQRELVAEYEQALEERAVYQEALSKVRDRYKMVEDVAVTSLDRLKRLEPMNARAFSEIEEAMRHIDFFADGDSNAIDSIAPEVPPTKSQQHKQSDN